MDSRVSQKCSVQVVFDEATKLYMVGSGLYDR